MRERIRASRRRWTGLLFAALLFAGVAGGGCKWGHSPALRVFAPSGLVTIENAIHQRINEIRREEDLEPLELDRDLRILARTHSHDMASRGVLTHRDNQGLYVASRATRARIDWLKVAENVARVTGYDDPGARAVQDWMESPGHRANILDDEYTFTGIGVVKGDDGYVYFTQVFLLPMPE
jgi:uncharacterized protein YkwD